MQSIKNNFDIVSKTKFFKANLTGDKRKWNNKAVSAIEIDVEELRLQDANETIILMERPVAVRGIIIPHGTKGRKAPPNPVAFDSLNKFIKSVVSRKRFRILTPHSDRGHVFGLELGGPNCKYNIMPQWSGFQEHGDWRRLERNLKQTSSILLENNNSLYLEVNIEYMNLNMTDLNERLQNIFSFKNTFDYSEDRVKKCLQIFGIPMSYSFDSCPCNIFLKKPRDHSLSIAYVKYLYRVALEIYNDNSDLKIESKIKNAQKKLNIGYGIKKISPTNFVEKDENLFKNLESFSYNGIFALAEITEEDL
jgi:hypothetical protein